MKNSIYFLLAFLFVTVQCAHKEANLTSPNIPVAQTLTKHRVTRAVASANPDSKDWIEALPGNKNDFLDLVKRKIAPVLKTTAGTAAEKEVYAERISKYLGFLMTNYGEDGSLTADALVKAKAKLADKIMARLMSSSTQFILCPDLTDYECLEKTPVITPGAEMRREDPKLALGKRVIVQESLHDSSEWFFTTQIMAPEDQVDQSKALASQLAKKIDEEGIKEIYMALYGIDDVDGSMKGVYDALMGKIASGVNVKGVFDQEGFSPGVTGPLTFTYIKPPKGPAYDSWILKPLDDGIKTNLGFQYNVGTQGLINALAANAKTELEAKGRIESKDDGIMHNKYFVFKNASGKYSVWTGTANVARTCMGTERNSNMGFFIKNDEVATSFVKEFKEMYDYAPEGTVGSKDFKGLKSATYRMGRFHGMKRPNTKRLFYFAKDNTDLKVYFSPTDDAEHRAILPMLHSAKAGDVLRISMFGAAGVDYVRAIQLAAARGVKVEILLDTPTGFTNGSWAARKADATLLEENPFGDGDIVLKKNGKSKGGIWKQNHQKIGILLRKEGNSYKAEQMIFGSQNWSASGNDSNDENLITLRNRLTGLKMAADFDKHFTEFLWQNADPISDSNDEDVPQGEATVN